MSSDDPRMLAIVISIIVLDSIFLGWVSSLTVGVITDTTPDIYQPRQVQSFSANFAAENISNATTLGVGVIGGLLVQGGWTEASNGWISTGNDNIVYLTNIHVNGYGNYDNTYHLSNPSNQNFDVFISAPYGVVSGGLSLLGANKKVSLEVRGNSFTIPTATVGGFWSAFVNNDKKATAGYNVNDFTIRTTYNETSTDTHVYLNNQEILSGSNLGVGYFYIGERKFGGIEAYGPGIVLETLSSSAITVSQSWYGDPITGFLLAAWNFVQTAFAFFVWDFSFPADWALAMNAIYMLGVRIPAYIGLFIGVRLLRGTG